MQILQWHERLRGDRPLAMLGEEERDGVSWIFAECWSDQAYESLFDTLWDQGYRTLARRDRNSIWIEQALQPA